MLTAGDTAAQQQLVRPEGPCGNDHLFTDHGSRLGLPRVVGMQSVEMDPVAPVLQRLYPARLMEW